MTLDIYRIHDKTNKENRSTTVVQFEKEMNAKNCLALVLVIVATLIKTLESGNFLKESYTEISNSTVLKRWEGLSSVSCLLRCRRNKECKMSAMIDYECLLLRNGTTSENEGNGTLRVILLQEMDTKIKPSKKG